MKLSDLEIAVLILAVWVFLVNVTTISTTVGWIMALVAIVFVLLPTIRSRS